jgi:DNA repair protein RadC
MKPAKTQNRPNEGIDMMLVGELQVTYRTKADKRHKGDALKYSKQVAEYVRKLYDLDRIEMAESFYLVLLNRANKPIGWVKISEGGINGTVVSMQTIVGVCCCAMAQAAIITHNHPSGEVNPSEADRAITRRIKEALKLVDVQLLDHIIVSATDEGKYYSFCDEGAI